MSGQSKNASSFWRNIFYAKVTTSCILSNSRNIYCAKSYKTSYIAILNLHIQKSHRRNCVCKGIYCDIAGSNVSGLRCFYLKTFIFCSSGSDLIWIWSESESDLILIWIWSESDLMKNLIWKRSLQTLMVSSPIRGSINAITGTLFMWSGKKCH